MPLPRGKVMGGVLVDQRHVRDARPSARLRPLRADGRARLGPTPTCCRISASSRIRGAASRAISAAPAARWRCGQIGDSPHFASRKPPDGDAKSALGYPTSDRSCGRTRQKVSRAARSRSTIAAAAARRGSGISRARDGPAEPRRASGQTGPPAGVRGQALRRGRDRYARRAAGRPGKQRSDLSGGTYTGRTCSCSPALARPRISSSTASRWSTTAPASAATCRSMPPA